ncbi:cellulose binding domain-containing protein [Actinosynnema sp. NPDC051121]
MLRLRRVLAALAVLVAPLATVVPAAADDLPAVLVDYGSTGTVANMPGSGSTTVRLSLSAPPAAPVTVTIDLLPNPNGTLIVPSRHTLVFTPTTWNTPQQVRLISVRYFRTADLTAGGPGVTGATIHAYANMGPLPPNVNYACRTTTTTTTWPGGFGTSVTVTNTGPTPITDWTVVQVFDADEKVGWAWNAEATQYLNALVLTPRDWNRTLAPGASATIGYQGTGTTTQPATGQARCTPEPYLL